MDKYARLWPREVFDITEQGSKHRLAARLLEELKSPGVYIRYRDEIPYYIEKTTRRRLFSRLHDHANKSTDRYFNFWNYFSVFVVRDPTFPARKACRKRADWRRRSLQVTHGSRGERHLSCRFFFEDGDQQGVVYYFCTLLDLDSDSTSGAFC